MVHITFAIIIVNNYLMYRKTFVIYLPYPLSIFNVKRRLKLHLYIKHLQDYYAKFFKCSLAV